MKESVYEVVALKTLSETDPSILASAKHLFVTRRNSGFSQSVFLMVRRMVLRAVWSSVTMLPQMFVMTQLSVFGSKGITENVRVSNENVCCHSRNCRRAGLPPSSM